MNPLKKMRLVSCSLVPLALLCAVGSVQAAPLVLDHVSALDAARQLSDKYGINIVFKGDFGPTKYVSFTLTDADLPGSRLEAVNSLANAVGADFTKTYVVSKVAADQDVPTVRVDNDAPIVFPDTTMSAQQAISAVAAVDSASAQFTADVTGNVTLSGTQMNSGAAAQEIAAQTHTRWKIFYAMLPRTNGRQTGGKVIGRTNGGSAITELPFVYYQHIPTPAEREAQAKTDAQNTPPSADNSSPMNGYPTYGDYNNGYNYGNPYGSPYGYGDNGGYVNNGSGLIIGTGGGFENGGPIVFQTYGY